MFGFLVTFFPLLSTRAAVSTLAANPIGITEYPGGPYPQGITAGPDGNLWYLGPYGVQKMTTSGTVTAYGFPIGGTSPEGITAGPDGNLWFTLAGGNIVAKVTTSGSFTEYTVPTANSVPYGITAGPDGNVWFTEYFGNKVAKVTPAGNITEYPLPPAGPSYPGGPPTNYPAAITAGPDGNLWTLEGGKATKVTTSGGITRYPTPSGVGNYDGIGPGPDGNVWFTEDTVNKVAKVTTSGSFTEYTAASDNFTVGGAQAIVGGPDGNIWFTEPDGNKVARMTSSGAITEFAVPTANSGPLGIAVGPDGYMWFTEWRGNNVAKIGPVLVPPTVTEVAPIDGNTTGGTPVTITGSGFTLATGVKFGSNSATHFTINSDTQITATSPPGSAGSVHVTVTNPVGTNGSAAPDSYLYVPPAISWQQYILAGSDGSTWMDVDANNLKLTLTPSVDSNAVVSGNADLWTQNAGVNQDLGIFISGGAYGTGQIYAWKESGGFAGTFSPNAAFVQTIIPLSGGATYTVKLQWKTNHATSGTIRVGAGLGPDYSPTRLTAELLARPTDNSLRTAVSAQQYVLADSDGSSWVDVDSAGLLSTSFTPGVDGSLLVGGNADLWTQTAGVNQDLGVFISGGDYGAGQVFGWKESGGFAGTFSPNAAFVQTVIPLKASTTYTVKLQWKANHATSGTIRIGAGLGPTYSPTRLTLHFFPGASGLTDAASTTQYALAGSDGSAWTPMDASHLSFQLTPAADSLYVLSANADLWTETVGVNQDLGISVRGGAFGDGKLVAWKESGGFAGTFSPNAAFVQTLIPLMSSTTYTVTVEWKANHATAGTMRAGAGLSPNFSPTRLSAQLFLP